MSQDQSTTASVANSAPSTSTGNPIKKPKSRTFYFLSIILIIILIAIGIYFYMYQFNSPSNQFTDSQPTTQPTVTVENPGNTPYVSDTPTPSIKIEVTISDVDLLPPPPVMGN